MRRLWIALVILLAVGSRPPGVSAQTGKAVEGDPPIASLITVSSPDPNGIVTISGAAGAVFPQANLSIRNLYTDQTTYLAAGATGGFTAKLYGPGNTPFWISPSKATIPPTLHGQPGSLPGGPGTIVYGAYPTAPPSSAPITPLTIDGKLTDWSIYPKSSFGGGAVDALQNQESLYLAATGPLATAAATQFVLTLDSTKYALIYVRQTPLRATLKTLLPAQKNLGTICIAGAVDSSTIELRVPLAELDPNAQLTTLNEVDILDPNGVVQSSVAVDSVVPQVAEVDGIPRPNNPMPSSAIRFTIGGALAQGASTWTAFGQLDRLSVDDRGKPLLLQLDVALDAPNLSADTDGLTMMGQVSLQPVDVARGGDMLPVSDLDANNGWSSVKTPSGLAVDNLTAEIPLGTASVNAPEIIRRGDALTFGLDFSLTIPADLPAGLYVPIFSGSVQYQKQTSAWTDDGLFGTGPGISRVPLTRLPVIVNVGAAANPRLLMALFEDDPSEGSRGVLADQDQGDATLSNRVRYDSPTYILPAHTVDGDTAHYSLEPYLPNVMPNAVDSTAAPLLPFLLPGGRLTGQVTKPDGTVDDLGSVPIVQNELSTAAFDERTLFGSGSPVDMYRLTTLNPRFNGYAFDQYGMYTISMTGNVEDVWGNRFNGGGTYHVLIAEPLTLSPGVLSGTPFEVGNTLDPTLNMAPAVDADVTVTARLYPLDGGPVVTHTLSGRANRFGYFYGSGDPIRFDAPGEYTVDYEARFTDPNGHLWAGSMRSAGVVASPDGVLIGHGARGLDDADGSPHAAWYAARVYAQRLGDSNPALRPNAPYFGGDVAWIADGPDGEFEPSVHVQDTIGTYQSWLESALTPDQFKKTPDDELPVTVMASKDTPYGPALLPDRIVNQSYTYFSAVRPGVTERQFVLGGDDGGLPLALTGGDPDNGQVGAGANGALPGDYLFLFGGAIVRTPQAKVSEAAIYGSLAVVIDAADPIGPRVFPPFRGELGGRDDGPLLVIDGNPSEIFFHPTAVQPGQALALGDTLSIAGQVAPTLPSSVAVTVTSPSGKVHQFSGVANAIGYYYDPANDFAVDETGIWTVAVQVTHTGLTSVGPVEMPAPTGGVPGTTGGRFSVYVVDPKADSIGWDRKDVTFPAGQPYNFTFGVPPGWSNVQSTHTLTMPGFVLEDAPLAVTGSTISYQYNPSSINKRFPNYESAGTSTGPTASDALTLTVAITGTDANGTPQIRVRVFNILHDRILSLDN